MLTWIKHHDSSLDCVALATDRAKFEVILIGILDCYSDISLKIFEISHLIVLFPKYY